MIREIQEINFPEYATLSTATVTLNDMGDKTISAQINIDGKVIPDFTYDWEVEFKGERYIHPLRQPQASKGNESISSIIDLTFYHKGIYELKRYYFVEMSSTESGTPIADKYIASLGLNLGDFCTAFNNVLEYYFDGKITIDLNPSWSYSPERSFIDISYSYLWDVLQKVHEIYNVRWYIEGEEDSYTIKIGYDAVDVSHIFQYGFDGGLLRVERQVQDANIRNSLLGRGGSKNIPTYYFKNAPEGSSFRSDPDAIPELANIYFSELRGKSFRDYVRGWKASHYGGASTSSSDAYAKGYSDDKFAPVEYVESAASIEKYGLLQGGLANNEDIYPSIQNVYRNGIGLVNEVVDVEPILSDDVNESIVDSSIITNVDSTTKNVVIPAGSAKTFKLRLASTFNVPQKLQGTLLWEPVLKPNFREYATYFEKTKEAMRIYEVNSTEELTSINIPQGTYYYIYEVSIRNLHPSADLGVTIGVEGVKLIAGNEQDAWKPTFDIWIKNVWDTEKGDTESDEQYVERVWGEILGARGEYAAICFTSGWLAVSDYEFGIVEGGIAYDTSKSYNNVSSEWRITLKKTDAEFESTGRYLPSAETNGQAQAGDLFIFTGIDMPQLFVEEAEARVDQWKANVLSDVADIKPTWVVGIDKVRVNTLTDEDKANNSNPEEETKTLLSQLNAGCQIHLADNRFIEEPYVDLYVQSISYTWTNASMLPDVEIVLSDKVTIVKNPVAQIQGDINYLKSQIGNSNLQQQVRTVGDAIYLRKDGIKDISKSETEFRNAIKGFGFRQGLVGGAGWGIYRDKQGQSVAEFDKLLVRNEMQVNNLVINQISHIGGSFICSAASMECSGVIETSEGYECFFDQREGTIANCFAINDIAYSSVWDENFNRIKYYKRIVVKCSDNSIVLSKTNKDGTGVPEKGDVIVQMGNKSNVDRQGIIIIDSIPVPTIAQYVGVDGFQLPEPMTILSPAGNRLTGVVNMLAGSTGLNNLEGLPEAINIALGKYDFEGMLSDLLQGYNFDDIFQSLLDSYDFSDKFDDYDFSDKFDGEPFGKANLLRNSGFNGAYLDKLINEANGLPYEGKLIEPTLEYWYDANSNGDVKPTTQVAKALADSSSVSASGVIVEIYTGKGIKQTIIGPIVKGDSYVLSFKAKSSNQGKIKFSIAGYEKNNITLTKNFTRYVEKFTAATNEKVLKIEIANATCQLCEIQLERGEIASAWNYSMWDNTSAVAYYKSLRYLADAIVNGSTSIAGGLILTQLIALGNYEENEMKEVTAGINGKYETNDDLAFWAGGDIIKATNTVEKLKLNPQYKPTEAEWEKMANFAVTHGGDVFLRGYIHALGGYFRGTVDIADQKILLNSDGSGHFANGNVQWDAFGRVKKSAPDSILWTMASAYSGTIDYSKGSYIVAAYDSNDFEPGSAIHTYSLATPLFSGYTVSITNHEYDGGIEPATLSATFFYYENGTKKTATKLRFNVSKYYQTVNAELVYQYGQGWEVRTNGRCTIESGVLLINASSSASDEDDGNYYSGQFDIFDSYGQTLATLKIDNGRITDIF